MSWYIFDSGPYRDWLRLDEIKKSIDNASVENARRVVGSIDDFKRQTSDASILFKECAEEIWDELDYIASVSQEQVAATKEMSSALDELRDDFGRFSCSFDSFRADFSWHTELLVSNFKQIDKVLCSLQQVLERKHRTEAFEFFQQSLEYTRHKRFEKALHYIDIAINGDGSTRGYELEWRFWEQLGRLRMGSEANTSEGVMDLAKAEDAFLEAATLATVASPNGAARCLLAAGASAYAQGRLNVAIQYAEHAGRHALTLERPEVLWQYSRYLWERGQSEDFSRAENNLFVALHHDPTYADRFLKDGIFVRRTAEFTRLINNLLNRFRPTTSFGTTLSSLEKRAQKLTLDFQRLALANDNMKDIITDINLLSRQASSSQLVDILFVASKGQRLLESLQHKVDQNAVRLAEGEARQRKLLREEQSRKESEQARIKAEKEQRKKNRRAAYWQSATTLWILLAVLIPSFLVDDVAGSRSRWAADPTQNIWPIFVPGCSHVTLLVHSISEAAAQDAIGIYLKILIGYWPAAFIVC